MITINTKSRLVRKKRLCLIILWFMTFGFIAVTCTQVTDFCLKCTIFLELKQKVVQSVHHKRKCRENHIKNRSHEICKRCDRTHREHPFGAFEQGKATTCHPYPGEVGIL